MTLLTTEGFETRTGKDGWSFTTVTIQPGRFGGNSFSIGDAKYSPPAPVDVIIVGLAYQVPFSPSNRSIVELYDSASGNSQAKLVFNADRTIGFTRISTAIGTPSSGPIGISGEWVWIELKGRLNDVTGFLEARVNGTVVCSFTGDTVGTTSAGQNNGITMVQFAGSSNQLIDDIYIADTLGPAPYNTYLGEVQIETLVPNGNGAASQFVGSDGNSTDNYLLVDELPAVDTDRVESSTPGQRDLYTFTDPVGGVGEVLAVMPCVAVSKTVPGPATVKLVDRLASGTERVSASKSVSNLVWRTAGPYVADAAGAAWTPASVAAAQFGVEVG